jgi:hypothetical protein
MIKLDYGPAVRDLELGMLLARLMLKEQSIEAFYADPMTEYCPCLSDFHEDFDRQRRHIICDILRRARKVKDKKAETFALGLLEEWMP